VHNSPPFVAHTRYHTLSPDPSRVPCSRLEVMEYLGVTARTLSTSASARLGC
jgi:hypothetical protein